MSQASCALLCIFCIPLLWGCSPQICCTYEVYGADELVVDSYRICQGKFAILEMQGIEVEELEPEALMEYRDTIQEDDILALVAYHPSRPDLVQAIRSLSESLGFRVKDGVLRVPDLPPVCVVGLSLDEARQKVQSAFQQEIADIEVFLNYRDRLMRKVDLAGMVALPTLPVDGKLRLFEALCKAKVPPHANFFMSYILRGGRPLAVDLHQLMNKGDMTQDVVLRGGDKIFIASPSDSKLFVMGEVLAPKTLNLPFGSMPLAEAIVSVGGIPFTGNKDCIQVIRCGCKQPKIYRISWQHIIHLPQSSLLLMPGDLVYISEKPITAWNRFISQLLPSFSGINAGYGAYRTLGLGVIG